jgi:hypothetical protein
MKKIGNMLLAVSVYCMGLVALSITYHFLYSNESFTSQSSLISLIAITIIWVIGSTYFWLRISQHLLERACLKKLKKVHACPDCGSEVFHYEKDNQNDVPTQNEELAPNQEAFIKPFVCDACGKEYDGFLYFEDKRMGFGFGGVLYFNLTTKKRRYNNPIDPIRQFRFRRQFFSNGILAGILMSAGLFLLITGIYGLSFYALVPLVLGVGILFFLVLNLKVYVI